MIEELKACPFCGGKIKLDEDDFYMFCCDRCGAGITFAKELEDGTATDCSKEESIEKWNRRVNDEFEAWLKSEKHKAIDAKNGGLLIARDGVWVDAFETFKKDATEQWNRRVRS